MTDARPKPCPNGVHFCSWVVNSREPMEEQRCDCGQYTWRELRQMALGRSIDNIGDAEAKDREEAG